MNQPDHQTTVLPLRRSGAAEHGGKAQGLARLIELGLPVPEGFVICRARSGGLPPAARAAYRAMGGGAVAVRSSAEGEDGREASFAGQYETVLDVCGETALAAAVQGCLASLEGERAAAYRQQNAGVGGHMSIVVQRMVKARIAGVLFTADPVESRRDRLVIDAVAGLGESLVSGTATPDHYLIDDSGRIVSRDLVGPRPLLDEAMVGRLVADARRAEAGFGAPLDLEWAITEDGTLFWLQARPITTLGADAHEFDTPAADDEVFTRANVGEMMPGAVCPLDISVTARCIDQGIQQMLVRCGALAGKQEDLFTMGVSAGHLFFNLSAMTTFSRQVGGSTTAQLTLAICGRVVEELEPGRPAHPLRRTLNGLRYAGYVLEAPRRVARLEREVSGFAIDRVKPAAAMCARIERALPFLEHTYDVHLQSSAGSGVLSGAVLGILSKGRLPSAEQQGELARLLAGASGVESAGMVADLDDLVDAMASQTDVEAQFVAAGDDQALLWLQNAGRAGAAFARFLDRHGHRSLRELSLHQPGWADDPRSLIRSLRTALAGRGAAGPAAYLPVAQRPPRKLRLLLRWAHQAVRRRERTKSLLVEVNDRFKKAYRHLARLMVAEGRLPDEDLLFFLSQDEIGRLARTPVPALAERARLRREVMPRQREMVFPMICIGRPEVQAPSTAQPLGDELNGTPVSRGRVRGLARVALSLEDAAAIQPGEILIAPVTDVGWTPFFRIIAGLATEVGSAISHGAVVAREYGLPAVVNLPNATHFFRTGDLVELDGSLGRVRRIATPDPMC